MKATEDITLSPDQLDWTPINLKFVNFRNIHNVQVFIKDNQLDQNITQIDYFELIGYPVAQSDMKHLPKATC